ncbi:MAG: hypothetical protein PHN88_02320 [Ignavibacteria bacterium]|nr:hypothetical protein [Ignavibacteria bacterium]
MKFLAPVLLFLMCCVIPSFTFAQIKMMHETEKAELDKVMLMKDEGIRRLYIYRFDIDEVDWQQDSSLVSDMKYDPSNQKFSEISTVPVYSESVIRINTENKILSREIFDSKNNLTGKTLYHYNSNSQLDKREIFLGDTKTFDELYEYEDNMLKKMKYTTSDGLLFSYSEFDSDKWGNLSEETKYNNKDEVEYRYAYTFDAKSNCLEEKISLGDKISTIISYAYSKGRLTEKITKDGEGKILSRSSFEYDGKGRLASEKNESPSVSNIKMYQYDNDRLQQIKITDEKEASNYLLKYYYE